MGIISKKSLGRELRALILLIFWIGLVFAEDFISEFEYGQMLYKDPRGVSCASCHGKLGKGEFIASFKDKNGTDIEFFGADIRGLGLKKFKRAVEKGGRIMPRYYLTDKEIEAIYKYVVQVNKIEKDAKKTEQNGTVDSIDSTISDDNKTYNDEYENNETVEDIEGNVTVDDNFTDEDFDENISEEENSSEDNNNGSIMSKIFKTSEEEQ